MGGAGMIQHRAICETAWDGAPFAHEWRMSWVVLDGHQDLDGRPFAVYSDDSVSLTGELTQREDGAGNGDHCGSFDTFDEACRHADALAVQADERANWGGALMAYDTITYARLPDGSWGIRGPATKLRVGSDVEVKRRGAVKGETQTETVAAIVDTTADGQIARARIAPRFTRR